MCMRVYINNSLVLNFLHGNKVYWGREEKTRNIYRERQKEEEEKEEARTSLPLQKISGKESWSPWPLLQPKSIQNNPGEQLGHLS